MTTRSRFFLRHRREIGFDAFQQLVQRHRCHARFHRTGVEAGNIEHRAENGLYRLERQIDVLDEIAFPEALPLDQRGGIKPRGIQRLEDIVASGSENRVLPIFASSADALASASSRLTRVSSTVRSATRCSSVSLACFSA